MLATPPIQPSGPLPVYCSACACQVDPTAWDCAHCGHPLHEPGATTTLPPIEAGVSHHSRPEGMKQVEGLIGGVLVVVLALVVKRYLLPNELFTAPRDRTLYWLPSGIGGHDNLLRWVALGFGIPILLWVFGVFNRR